MMIKSLSSLILLLLININLQSSTIAFTLPPPPPATISRKNITTNKIMSNTSRITSKEEVVTIGPDLNSTRSKMDKKLYRFITLANGLKCVLICDTTALRQRKLDGYYDDDDSESGDSEDKSDDSDDEEEDDDGLRKAATALLVNVGSYHDPPYLQGLAHFCEHMLFLGTEDFSVENEYDKFLSQHGGDDNAYTDMEHTLYHYCIPQDGSNGDKTVWKALEMFSSFFKCPLLKGDSAERELNAVESEFELNKKDDDNRLSQLMAYTCGMDGEASIMGKEYKEKGTKNDKPFHPFAKFPWGNMQSLRTEPESNGINVMNELRDFYNTHYYARNMRLVVMAGYELDEIQRRVVEHFKDVPASPRVFSDGIDASTCVTNLHPYKLPFHSSSLQKLYRVIPVRNHHTLSLTWQIPSLCPQWKTKPADYIGHLLGHEASGSILSVLKEKGYAMSLTAGTGEDGLGDASTHALFSLDISLSKRGMKHWEEVIKIVYVYIGMLRYHFLEGHDDESEEKKEGLAPWIYNELKSIAELSYMFADEGDVTDAVEEVAENMAPWCNLPDERVLDNELLLGDEVDNDAVKTLLFDHLTPENMRVDLMSSLFGRDADFNDDSGVDEEEKKEESEEDDEMIQPVDLDYDNDDEDHCIFDKEKAGPASIEPRFGTKYWVEEIPTDVIQHWTQAAQPQLPSSDLAIDLPPKNTYIPTKLDLKPLPSDDAHHPLLNCSVKVCISVGKKKLWVPAAVTKFKTEKAVHSLSLSYEDEGEKWHILDDHHIYEKLDKEDDQHLEVGHEGSFDKGKKFKVTAVPQEGEGIVFNYGDSGHDYDVEDGLAFPPIPPASPESRLPCLVYEKNSIKMWHLQDRKFKRPTADLRISFTCDGLNDSALNQACMSLFIKLCADALTETCYLASVCDLGSSLGRTDTGFSIRVHGYDDNLMALTKEVLGVVMSFRGRDDKSDLPSTIKDGRFEACLEVLLRQYSNAGMDASSFSASLRLLCLRPSMKSSFSKLKALQGITIATFVKVMNNLLKKLTVEALYHGNVDKSDANKAANVISEALTCHHVGLPKKKMPSKLVMKTKSSIEAHKIIVPTIDEKDPNTAVEVYFQFAKDDNSETSLQKRVLVDLLEHIIDEPMYNTIRTKEQFGYEVSCGSRWTYGVLGMSFRVVTSIKSAEEASNRIDRFLKSFRAELQSMDDETYMQHLVSVAMNKLEGFDSMADETASHWSEIVEGRYEFEAFRKEVLCLKGTTKEQLLSAFDEWLNPVCSQGLPKKRRRLIVHVIGSGEGPSSDGRPKLGDDTAVGDEIDRVLNEFYTSIKQDSW